MSGRLLNTEYRFTETQDWFSGNIPIWSQMMPLVTASTPKILEIGSWEGRSAVFLLTSPLCASGGSIVCIDHFDLLRTRAGLERHSKVHYNLALTNKSFRVLDSFSVPALMLLLEEAMGSEDAGFDWLYIDGSHEADDTFLDAELAWRLARKDAIFIFDDYLWDKEPENSIHHPKRGINAFLQLHEGEFRVLYSDYQIILQKVSEMRIGFLLKDKGDVGLEEALGYGVNIALTINSSYAMPAAVTIRSIVENTSSRTTFYVVDCGLRDEDKLKIRSSIPDEGGVTLVFLPQQDRGWSMEMGVTWAKIDMIKILPVERVLYLDADTLIRGDIKPLWDTDLDGKVIGAVQDVGYPLGHDEIDSSPYFNAGVLLMDLAQIRKEVDGLDEIVKRMRNSKYHDQDALNVHFKDRWAPLRLGWNAQGLGTYANLPSAERDLLDLEEMEKATIVHFTGPVSPPMEGVLNPYVQPCTCKPWGYLRAPGHPHAGEWWEILEKTSWSPGWSKSVEYVEWCEREIERVKQAAIDEFSRKIETINSINC